ALHERARALHEVGGDVHDARRGEAGPHAHAVRRAPAVLEVVRIRVAGLGDQVDVDGDDLAILVLGEGLLGEDAGDDREAVRVGGDVGAAVVDRLVDQGEGGDDVAVVLIADGDGDPARGGLRWRLGRRGPGRLGGV